MFVRFHQNLRLDVLVNFVLIKKKVVFPKRIGKGDHDRQEMNSAFFNSALRIIYDDQKS